MITFRAVYTLTAFEKATSKFVEITVWKALTPMEEGHIFLVPGFLDEAEKKLQKATFVMYELVSASLDIASMLAVDVSGL
jgi:hypothetical protein